MSDNDPTNEPTPGPDGGPADELGRQQIPGWPNPSGPPSGSPFDAPSGPPSGSPFDATTPPPAGPPPGSGPVGYPPPSGPPAPGGYAPAGGYAPPGAAPGYGYPYANPAMGGYPVTREHPQGTTILVLGICSWVICGICGPFAWSMGNKALKEIDRNPAAYSNRGNVQAGRILGMVYTIMAGVIFGLIAVMIIIGIASGGSST